MIWMEKKHMLLVHLLVLFLVLWLSELFSQGGRKLNLTIYDGKKYDVQFPIAYAKECIGVLQTLEWPTAIGGASVAYTDKRTTTGYTIVADASSASYNSDLFYVALGI